MDDNYYHILGLDNFASPEEIKSAYRKLAKKYHPDKNQDKPQAEEKFKRVSKAYQVLSNPDQKAKFDYLLQYKQETGSPSRPRSTRPVYAPRTTYYTTEKPAYTARAWMYGRIFIAAFIVAIVVIPLTLFHYSSIKFYEEGLEAYQQGYAYEALNRFNQAIMLFGGRSVEAGIKGAEISIYALNNYPQGHYFINRALKYADEQSDLARLSYLRAMTYKGQQKYKKAFRELLRADTLQYTTDSIQLQLGLLRAFHLSDCKEAAAHFNYLLGRNIHLQTAWFGKAWCMQSLGLNNAAVNAYSEVIKINPESGVAHYYRGINKLRLHDTTAACIDFAKAKSQGYPKAADRLRNYCENGR